MPETLNVSEQGVGKDSYIMTLGGIESWAKEELQAEIGLFRDTQLLVRFRRVPSLLQLTITLRASLMILSYSEKST